MSFKDFVQSELEEQTTSSSSTSKIDSQKEFDLMADEDAKLSDEEGEKIALALKAKYLGHNYGYYWLNDNFTGSAYLIKDFQHGLKKREVLWANFKRPRN